MMNTLPSNGFHGQMKDPFPDIPQELKLMDQWLLYRLVWDEEKGKHVKKPTRWQMGKNGSIDASFKKQWLRSYNEVARQYMQRDGHTHQIDGIGFGFDGQHRVKGIDLDGCLKNGSEKLAGNFKKIVDGVPSWTEVSASGKGLHIFYIDPNEAEETGYTNKEKGVEFYSGGRYFAMTGNRFNGHALAEIPNVGAFMGEWRTGKANSYEEVQVAGEWVEVDLSKYRGLEAEMAAWKEDDSALAAHVADAMAGAGADRQEIASALSDERYPCSAKALKERGNRASAYKWAYKYQADRACELYGTEYRKEAEVPKVKKTKLKKLSTLKNRRFPKVHWAIHGLIPQGVTLFFAQPKAGKSRMALDLCLEISQGEEVFKKFQTTKSAILYLAIDEQDEQLLQERVKALGNRWPSNFYYEDQEVPLLDEGFGEWVDEHIKEDPEIKVLVIDTLADIYPEQNKGGNAYQFDSKTSKLLTIIARKHRLAIIVLHHDTKAQPSSWSKGASGTQGRSGKADVLMFLQKQEHESKAKLRIVGRRVAPQALEIEMHSNGSCEYVGDLRDEVSEARLEIWNIAVTLGRRATAGEFAERRRGYRESANKRIFSRKTRELLDRMVDAGHMKTAGARPKQYWDGYAAEPKGT